MRSRADWTSVWSTFHRAMEFDPEHRLDFIEHADLAPPVRDEVRSLLQSEAVMDDFLAAPADGSPAAIAPHATREGEDDGEQDPLIGRTVGRYTVRRRIGRGGMGVVYEAEQAQPRQRVALKLLRADVISRRALRRFTAEADILARLKHPNIARVYDAGTFDQGEGGRPYFAMELVSGEPITAFARRHELDTRARLELVAEVCDAVHHAHQRGVIHRDLKPGNVLVEMTDGRPRPKVLDFGVARVLDLEAAATTLTARSEIVGTLPYMSPEQIDGRSDVGALTDVYALGVLLHEVLAERLPYDFGSGSMLDAMQAIREQRPQALSAIHRRWRGEIETIVSKALEKEPERRYQSVAALADDLRRFLRDEPILARAPSRVYHLRTFVRRNRALAIAAGLAAMMLIAGAAVSTWQAVRAREAETVAIERFEDVRGLAHTVIFELEPAIARLPGATPARRMLVDAAVDYLERLEQSAGDDPELLRELALAYERLGDVIGNVTNSNLGDLDGGRRHYEQSLAIWERLLAAAPDEVDLQFAHLRLELRCAQMRPAAGSVRFPKLREDYEVILTKLRGFYEVHPRRDVQRELARALRGCAVPAMHLRQDDRAVALFQEAIAITRDLRAAPDLAAAEDLELTSAIGLDMQLLAQTLRRAGRLEAALRRSKEAMQFIEQALARYADDHLLVHCASQTRLELAKAMMANGLIQESLTTGREALSFATELLHQDESNQRTFRWYGVAHAQLAELHADAGANESLPTNERLAHWREALRLHSIGHVHRLERQRRGWLSPWESHYIEDGEREIATCNAAIAELRANAVSNAASGTSAQ